MNWLGWAVPTVFSIVIGVIAFFAKRTINKRDKAREAKDAKWEQDQQEMKKLITDGFKTFREENEKRHCKTEDRIGKVEERLNETLRQLPEKYTLREDWMRFSSKIDIKLDNIQESILNVLAPIVRGGKGSNERP